VVLRSSLPGPVRRPSGPTPLGSSAPLGARPDRPVRAVRAVPDARARPVRPEAEDAPAARARPVRREAEDAPAARAESARREAEDVPVARAVPASPPARSPRTGPPEYGASARRPVASVRPAERRPVDEPAARRLRRKDPEPAPAPGVGSPRTRGAWTTPAVVVRRPDGTVVEREDRSTRTTGQTAVVRSTAKPSSRRNGGIPTGAVPSARRRRSDDVPADDEDVTTGETPAVQRRTTSETPVVEVRASGESPAAKAPTSGEAPVVKPVTGETPAAKRDTGETPAAEHGPPAESTTTGPRRAYEFGAGPAPLPAGERTTGGHAVVRPLRSIPPLGSLDGGDGPDSGSAPAVRAWRAVQDLSLDRLLGVDQETRDLRSARLRRVGTRVGGVALAGVLVYAVFPVRTYLDQRADTERTREQIETLDAASDRLEEQAERLRTDPEIERLAREQYGLVRPGEESYGLLPAPEETTTTTAPPPQQPQFPTQP
jgi:cell division protein FtsB